MKSMAKAILFGSVILAAQAAMADNLGFPAAGDDNAYAVTPRSTYADEHGNDSTAAVPFTYPAAGDDESAELAPRSTYADEHRNDGTVASSAFTFPAAGDDNTYELAPRSTYTDAHLSHSMQAYPPMQGTDLGN